MTDVDITDLTITYDSGGYVVRPVHHLNLHVGSGELAGGLSGDLEQAASRARARATQKTRMAPL